MTVFVFISSVLSWRWQRGQCIGSLRLRLSQSHPLDSLSPRSLSSPRSMKSLLRSSQGSLVLCWCNPTLLISVSSQWICSGQVTTSHCPHYGSTILISENLENALRIFPPSVMLSLLWLFSDILDLAPIQRWNPCNFLPWFCLARIRNVVFTRSLSLYGSWEKNIRIQ